MVASELLLRSPLWQASRAGEVEVFTVGFPDDRTALTTALVAEDWQAVSEIGGAWSAIVQHRDRTIIATDLVRSYPLFFETDVSPARVSDDIETLLAARKERALDAEARVTFLRLGYVTGSKTLFSGVSQLGSGEHREIGQARVIYRRLRYSGRSIASDAEANEHFRTALHTALGATIERANGRQLVIPLSGGLDSRLMSTVLKDLNYDNVVNFTYGRDEQAEASISKRVATSLGQRWDFYTYAPDRIRSLWSAPENAAFLTDSYGGSALPHIQDWLAVRDMREKSLVDDNAIFLPGHTIVGNLHDEAVLDPTSVSTKSLSKTILEHHDTLQPMPHPELSLANAELDQLLDEFAYDGSPVARAEAIENWNIRERQTKYINNSVRTYEHFGYGWALPMLDPVVVKAWENFDLTLTRNREWYARFVDLEYGRVSGDSLKTFTPSRVPSGTRRVAKRLLSATGLLKAAERRITARAVANHAMSFSAFSGSSTDADLQRFVLRGGAPLGLFANEFLADTWNPHTNLFPA